MGSKYANVLPLPVSDVTSTSRPASTSGIAIHPQVRAGR
jgi:hypothetical protein